MIPDSATCTQCSFGCTVQLQDDDGQTILVTASFGIAISTTELRPQQLLSRADKALYEAKACGRNIVKTYSAHSSPILLTET